ncbi:adenylate/guanylate cyclase domain-containing protein [Pengzhenrongella sicca]|uniref:Adenylate/guanylate cyclase domain-containing protein n=1 Tax=Pengzhenrongella sicca TaxID=2819238 RepID=A0A8A4ZBI5_9MICO|nr:adenylate/guanylate cyclase domain-containing protein [Pengzhenrongella sicca]QTE28775.1 adenylate/guanylate cyclase domain-containing protein [Pengzhenrongella sicca]
MQHTAVGPGQEPAAVDSTVGGLDALLLGGARTLTLRDLAERSGPDVDVEDARVFWSTLGLPHADPDDPVFTEDDAAAIMRVAALIRSGEMNRRTAVTLTRALGHTSERLVLWQVEALVEDAAARYQLDDTSARLVVLDRLAQTGPLLEAQLVHSWRRHLAAMAGRIAAEFGEVGAVDHPDPTALPLARAVGFADMVSFTRRTAGLGPTDLSAFVQRFETIARDVVTEAGGRVVKTIGDAVLFIADDVATGADVALGLARVLGTELDVAAERTAGGLAEGARGVTPVRVGFVQGRVLSRFGDVFGASVNLAARLTDIAEPSTVLTDETTAALLAASGRFRLAPQPVRDLAGLGAISPVRVESID